LNRAIQGRYAPGTVLGPFILAAVNAKEGLDISEFDPASIGEAGIECALNNVESNWAAAVIAGCSGAQIKLAELLGEEDFNNLLNQLDLFTNISLDAQIEETSSPLPAVGSPEEVIRGQSDLRVSPFQIARAAASLSAGGEMPEPQLTAALNIPGSGWMIIPATDEHEQVFPQLDADKTSWLLADDSLPIWQAVGRSATSADQFVTWYIAGTLPSWTGARFTLVTVLEADAPQEALEIGRQMMETALQVE
jgi:cell division protein FtsI/penicillin-binding protein 2